MPEDALDPGPNGDWPLWPRRPDGTPDPERMPSGRRWQRDPRGEWHLIDLTPRHPHGPPIVPPSIEP